MSVDKESLLGWINHLYRVSTSLEEKLIISKIALEIESGTFDIKEESPI